LRVRSTLRHWQAAYYPTRLDAAPAGLLPLRSAR
jgi:hypothetical protein